MFPFEPYLPDEPPSIREPAEGEIGVPRHRGLSEQAFTIWIRLLVWSQIVAITVLGIAARLDARWGDSTGTPALWLIVSAGVLASSLHIAYVCPIVVLLASLASPNFRAGCLLVLLELALAITAFVAISPEVQ